MIGAYFDNPDNLMFGWESYFPQAAPSFPVRPVEQSAAKAKVNVEKIMTFSAWLNASMPEVYQAVMMSRPDLLLPEFAASGLAGLSEDQPVTSVPETDWGKKILEVASPLLQVWQQKELMKVNVARAERGLAPIDVSQIAPQVQVRNPQLEMLGKVAVFGLLGLGAVALIARLRK